MKTEELGGKIARLIFKHKYSNLEWEDYVDTMLEKQQCIIVATQILEACKKAGLASVVKDAVLPRNLWTGDYGYGYGQARDDMLKAGYKMWEEI